jgi:LysR family transcriptional regulator, glycine cleavage system transcriptional activator
MARDLPSLNAIRMFEAAARHGNFTRAAEQLHVTQGAVSRQIKHLEDDLRLALFHRDGPKIELTDAGEVLFKAADEALAILRRGTVDLRRMSATPTLTVSVLPSFAAKWLVPRMAGFQDEHRNIDVRLAADYEPVDFSRRPDIDLAIRFGTGDWSGLYSECLINEQMFPACSERFLKSAGPIKKPESLLDLPLLIASGQYDQWNDWFEAAGAEPPRHTRGPQYTDASMLLQAAIEGQGVALVRSLLSEEDIRTGRLVRLFATAIDSRYSYYFVCPHGRETDEKIQSFLRWLRAEASRTDAACKKHTL